MEKISFLNVPEDICAEILKLKESCNIKGYRALYHKGNPLPTDFYPTFDDDNQERIRNERQGCGSMAKSVVSQHNKLRVKDCCVSLFTSAEKLKDIFWRNDSVKKDYPAIAEGYTDNKKGYAVKDNENHISYYLFNYLANNPCNDFITIEEAEINE